MTSTTQTTALVPWTSEIADSRRVPKCTSLHLVCLRVAELCRETGARGFSQTFSPTGQELDCPSAAASWVSMAGEWLGRAVEASR